MTPQPAHAKGRRGVQAQHWCCRGGAARFFGRMALRFFLREDAAAIASLSLTTTLNFRRHASGYKHCFPTPRALSRAAALRSEAAAGPARAGGGGGRRGPTAGDGAEPAGRPAGPYFSGGFVSAASVFICESSRDTRQRDAQKTDRNTGLHSINNSKTTGPPAQPVGPAGGRR